MLGQYLLQAALVLPLAIKAVVANPGDVLACVPCPNNVCQGVTYRDHCASQICGNSVCIPEKRKRAFDLSGYRDVSELSPRDVVLGRVSRGCLLWVQGQDSAGESCDYCDVRNGQSICRVNSR